MLDSKGEVQGSVSIEVPSASAHLERTVKWIEQDIVFFCRAAASHDVQPDESKRSARISILLMAMYLESLSHLLFSTLCSELLLKALGRTAAWRKALEIDRTDNLVDVLDKKTDVPRPLRRLRVLCLVMCQRELDLPTDGLCDIFIARNRILAHPSGFSVEIEASEPSINKRVDRAVHYRRFETFPTTYSGFSHKEADLFLREIAGFLVDFHELLSPQLQQLFAGRLVGQQLLEACYPDEILEYLEPRASRPGCLSRR